MIELSARTVASIDALFTESDAVSAKDLLAYECGDNVPFCEHHSPVEMDRIRLAAVKLSNGSYTELKRL